MFYPVESLRRGGRFYLCWVADSWPLRFAAITHRQLWSQDIRTLCDDLLEVMTNESGRPNHRFSLRLSSQLLRGLVRLYERKATVLYGDLCMIGAIVFKSANKKRTPKRQPLQPASAVVPEEPENAQRVEELIQNSGNVVRNIQDITLKEVPIPEFRLPPNDNFGEENPDQALQTLLADRTIEMMMQETSGAGAGAQVSGLDLHMESVDKSRDKSRLTIAVDAPQMESVAELDVTMFRKSAGDTLPGFEKDIPEIPEIPIPVPVPTEPVPPEPQEPVAQEKEKEKTPEVEVPPVAEIPVPVVPEPEVPAPEVSAPEVPAPEVPVPEVPVEPPKVPQPVDEELEALEDQPPRAKRRRRGRGKLIIDRRTRLASDFLRARIDNPHVDMRFEDFTDAIVDIRVPWDTLMHEPAHRGCDRNPFATMSDLLCRLFRGRLEHILGYEDRQHRLDRQPQQLQAEPEEPRQRRTRSRSALEKIAEVEEIEPQPAPNAELEMTRRATDGQEQLEMSRRVTEGQEEIEVARRATEEQQPTATEVTTEAMVVPAEQITITAEVHASRDPLAVPGLEVPNVQDVTVPMQVDISDLPTQKLETLSQIAAKRTSKDGDHEIPPKRRRSAYITFKGGKENVPANLQEPAPQQPLTAEGDKENIPANLQDIENIPANLQDKKNIPANLQDVPAAAPQQPSIRLSQELDHSQVASRLLQEAGLSDMQQYPTAPQAEGPSAAAVAEPQQGAARKPVGDENEETPLGSLDRTKVSLGDSAKTTDSQRFIRKQWGVEGTMLKIMVNVKAGGPVTVQSLLRRGPVIQGMCRIIAARCFSSILKLKQHGFVRVEKDPSTLEITNISLGPRFDNL